MDRATYQVLIYRGTRNLGDAIQAVAMSRLLGGTLAGVYRDAARLQARPEVPFVVNGWLGDEPPAEAGNCAFAGVFLGARLLEQARWLAGAAAAGRAVGSRDKHTSRLLGFTGVRSDVAGCPTLTFDRYAGARSGRLAVDAGPWSAICGAEAGPAAAEGRSRSWGRSR